MGALRSGSLDDKIAALRAAEIVERLDEPRDPGRDSGGGDARMFRMVES
jgi:hypothetical protein